tara:strand:- start:1351 stop:1626 length:276 start_codon:yes stop_codon:yes gene_type:complete
MARFRATVQGNRGAASRLGHRTIEASVNGWDCGIDIVGMGPMVESDDRDSVMFNVYLTGGSNSDDGYDEHIATITRRNGKTKIIVDESVNT